MPNYTSNIIKMKGIASMPIYSKEGELDFSKIVSMPEELGAVEASTAIWAVTYFLTERCTKPRYMLPAEDLGIIEGLAKQELSAKNTEDAFMSSLGTAYGMADAEKDAFFEKGRAYTENIRRYGYPSWYEWCIAKWGTKWNACSTCVTDNDTVTFCTAWDSPVPVMLKLSGMHPDAMIEHWWADEDKGMNTGHAKYLGGRTVSGGYYEDCSDEAYGAYALCWGDDEECQDEEE